MLFMRRYRCGTSPNASVSQLGVLPSVPSRIMARTGLGEVHSHTTRLQGDFATANKESRVCYTRVCVCTLCSRFGVMASGERVWGRFE